VRGGEGGRPERDGGQRPNSTGASSFGRGSDTAQQRADVSAPDPRRSQPENRPDNRQNSQIGTQRGNRVDNTGSVRRQDTSAPLARVGVSGPGSSPRVGVSAPNESPRVGVSRPNAGQDRGFRNNPGVAAPQARENPSSRGADRTFATGQRPGRSQPAESVGAARGGSERASGSANGGGNGSNSGGNGSNSGNGGSRSRSGGSSRGGGRR